MIDVPRIVENPYSRVINASRTCQKHLRPSWENFIPENDSVFNAAWSVKHDIENVQNLPSDSFSTLFHARIYKHKYYCIYVLFSLRLTSFYFFAFHFVFYSKPRPVPARVRYNAIYSVAITRLFLYIFIFIFQEVDYNMYTPNPLYHYYYYIL